MKACETLITLVCGGRAGLAYGVKNRQIARFGEKSQRRRRAFRSMARFEQARSNLEIL